MKPLLGGNVYEHELDGWSIRWESQSNYRHWCVQAHPMFERQVVVVMKNPGSLKGDGSNLKRDTTLRVLRRVGERVKCSWYVVNLFDFASTSSNDLYKCWKRRDGAGLVYRKIHIRRFCGILFAHGDAPAEVHREYEERIALVRKIFKKFPEIRIPATKAGNPVHPLNWQRNRLIEPVVKLIRRQLTAVAS